MKKIVYVFIATMLVLCLSSQIYATGQTDLIFTHEIPKPSYTIKISSDWWKKDSQDGLTVISNADFTKLVGVKIDGILIDVNNYTAQSGSTIIILKSEYLQTLALGKHTVELVFTDGSVQTGFTILNADGISNSRDKGNPTIPNTGYDSNIIVWMLIGGISIIMLGIIEVFEIHKKRYK